MKNFWKPLIAVIVFVMMQAILGIVVMIPSIVKNADKILESQGDISVVMQSISMETLAWATLLSGVLTVVILSFLKMIDWKQNSNFSNFSLSKTACYILAAVFGIFAMDILQEILNLPNILEEELSGMATTFLGFITIGIVGPVCEELIFREAILGSMLKGGVHPWRAVIISAVLFGMIHGNPAQIPFAAAVGVILGYVYYNTGNVVVSSIIHIINNSLSCVLFIIYGAEMNEFSWVDMLGGLPVAVAVIVLATLLCAYLLRRIAKSN